MKKTLKNLIGLMLVFALLIVPATNTAMAASIQLEGNKYIDGGGIFADLIIPNPAYTEQENLYPNVSNEGSSTRSQTLTNGIYRIKNAFNGKYMDTNGGGTTAGTAIVQWDKSEYYGGTTTVNPNQLFKVTYIGTSDGAECYSIRPMTNNEMGVSAPKTTSVSTVDIQPMSVTETTTNIYNYQEWIISSYGSYYTIANTYSATRYLSAPSSSTNGLQMIMSSSITSNAQWIFEAYTESIDRMSMVSFSDTLKIGDTFDFDAVMGSSTMGRNGGVTYSVQNTDGTATDKATINAATGVLTALKEGTVQIVTTYTNAPWLWIWNVEIKRYNFTLYGVPSYNAETGYTHDHLSALTYAQNILLNSGYDDVSIKTSNFNANSTKYILSNSAVFTIRSHGNHILDANGDVLATYVIFEDTVYMCLFSNYVEDMAIASAYIGSTDSFEKLEIAVFVGCMTGSGGAGSNNLPTQVVNKGATVAIGFKNTINCTKANDWTQKFYDNLLEGLSVYQAAMNASADLGSGLELSNVVICGDSSYVLE